MTARFWQGGDKSVVESIKRDELKAKMDRGGAFILIDTLGPGYYESSHLPGAINLPYEYVDETEKVLPDQDAEIIVYCMNMECSASSEEAHELTGSACARVLHYAEGKQGWIRAGLPVEGKLSSTPSRL